VKLASVAARIVRVEVNGQELDPSSYRLDGDHQNIELSAQTEWPLIIDVKVEFSKL